MEEDYNLAERYRVVRKHLDRLGYRQALSLDALPLIERLLADLIQTTDSLKHFKTVAQDNIEACSQLQLATEPYKCDNARLVQECNDLHLKLLDTNETHQKQVKELKKQVRKLEIECSDLQLALSRNVKKIKELEAESAGKSAKIIELQGKCCKPVISNTNLAVKKRACYPLRRPALEADPLPRTASSSSTLPSSRKVDPHVVDLLGMADHRMNCLNREVTKLKGDLSIQSENIRTYKSQLATKEKEIMRLKKMLDGGRPLSAVTKDCFCKTVEKKKFGDVGELKVLERAKHDLEEQLKDSMAKQHEAMSRALKLAERNEELEKELRDIDHIALAVEADCNSAVQENNRRVCRLQEKVEDLMTQVHVLESELTVERREAQELRADIEACKLEKRNIQRVLESTLDEKKQMTDKINQLTIIEKDLNETIERLTKSCVSHRQEIVQLESSNNILKDQVYKSVGDDGGGSGSGGGGGVGGGGDDREKNKEKGEKNDKNKGKKILKKKTAAKPRSMSPTMNKQSMNGPREDEVTKDVSNAVQNGLRIFENQKVENEKDFTIQSMKKTIERLETERDYYRNEYNRFREEFNLISNGDNADLWTQACELRRQLNEKEQAMAELQREKKALDREKFNLEARLQTSKSQQKRSCILCSPYSSARPTVPCNCSIGSSPSGGDATSTKAMMERLERDRDTARADVDRLVEERDALRERLKIAVDAHTSEQRRLRESLGDAETRLKKLEAERQDLMHSQGTRRATINGLEDQVEDLKQELRRTKEELTTQRTQYFQLRALQEQTDQALGDVQGQLGQSETELNKMIDHKRNIEQQQTQLDNQVKELKQECNMLRSNLAQLDQEKDQLLLNLDEKTERIAALEREVRFKEQQENGLEQQVLDFQHKYQICVDQSAEQERQLRAMEVEMNNLQRQLTSASMDRENAIRENSRIQDDLAAITCECRNLQRELEASRAESYDLKRQLQTYVTEVRRAEELLNRKENERSEMLNHFRSLSLEATVLETNNQSLESEAAEARGALQNAQDRLLDLERQIADRDCLIRGYETQIAELTQNVASMETQLHQQADQRKRAESDLNAVRDLCVKLDQQKESLESQLADKEAMRAQCESQLGRLRAEQNMVQDQMTRDNAAVDRLETMLSQARQESMSNQASNQELQNEMSRLKQKISDLQNKLLAETSELKRYQNQAAEYSKQISELRRQMTNERFDRARKEEESRRANSPRSFEKETCPPCSASQVPTPAPRPDPKSVNQWKIPAPSHRIPVESTEGCSCKPDLKKEARRTNRFNTSSCNNFATSNLTPYNHLESNSRTSNDYKTQEKDEMPCINIILKPILDPKTELKDKSVQIVEVTAVTENLNKYSIDDSNLLPFDTSRDEPLSRSSMREKVKTKCVKIQTEDGKILRDRSMQTAEPPNDRKSIGICKTNQSTPENRSVQFRDDEIITDDFDHSNLSPSGIEFLSQDNNFEKSTNFDGAIMIHSSDTQHKRKTIGEASMNRTGCLNAMEISCQPMKDEGKMSGASDLKTCAKNLRGDDAKLSERIKRKIDKLANTSSKEMKSQSDFQSCTDVCKEIATQEELSHKTRTSVNESNSATKNTDTLPSVFSNNSPIPKVSIDTTDMTKWELSSPINNSSKVNKFSDSRVSSAHPPSSVICCSDKNSTAEDIPPRSRNLTSEENPFVNIPCGRQQYPEKNGATICSNKENKSTLTEKNVEKFDTSFSSNEAMSLSEIGIAGNSSAKTKSTNTSNELESPVDRWNLASSNPMTRNTLHASDLTRPEFIRMLTEIKEHTCSLEIQLSAMNEAMKRKQATRNKAFSSTLRNYETPRRGQNITGEKENGKSVTMDESMYCTSEISSIENGSYAPEELEIDDSTETLCRVPSDDDSLPENRRLKNEFEDDDKTCCKEMKSHKKLKPSSRIDESIQPEEVILLPEDSNVSLRKPKLRKPVFKTRRSSLWAPLRHSDYRMWKRNLNKAIPSAESVTVCGIISQSISPETSVVRPKIDASCSPTSCCGGLENSSPTPVLKTMFEAASMRSGICSTTSNPFVNRTNAKPSFVSSTPKKLGTKYRISNESGSKSDQKLLTVPQLTDLDSSKHSDLRRKYSKGTRKEPVTKATDFNEKHVFPRPSFVSGRPKLKSRLGIAKQSTSEDQAKDYRAVMPSDSRLSPLESKESFGRSRRNVVSKNSRTLQDSNKRSSFQSNKLGRIPRLKRNSIRRQNPLPKNDQPCVDAACSSTINRSEIISEGIISPHSNGAEFLPAEKTLFRNVACGITSDKDAPISANNFGKCDSEEEVLSTDYAVNKSFEGEYRCEEYENNCISKKRKRKSGSTESTGFNGKSGFDNSIDSKATGNSENNYQSFQYPEKSGYGLNGTKKAKSIENREGDHLSENCCKNNSQQNDSKCTIRVTVSLDETPSNEEVKKMSEL